MKKLLLVTLLLICGLGFALAITYAQPAEETTAATTAAPSGDAEKQPGCKTATCTAEGAAASACHAGKKEACSQLSEKCDAGAKADCGAPQAENKECGKGDGCGSKSGGCCNTDQAGAAKAKGCCKKAPETSET